MEWDEPIHVQTAIWLILYTNHYITFFSETQGTMYSSSSKKRVHERARSYCLGKKSAACDEVKTPEENDGEMGNVEAPTIPHNNDQNQNPVKGSQPCSEEDILKMVTVRLSERNIFTSQAIKYLARKISSQWDDIGKALDVCSTAIKMAEKALLPRNKLLPTTGQIDTIQVAKMMNQVYGKRMTVSLSQGK